MRGFPGLLLLCIFCTGWSAGTASDLSQAPTPAPTPAPEPWQPLDHPTQGATVFFPPHWRFFEAGEGAAVEEELAGAGRSELAKLLRVIRSGVRGEFLTGIGFALPGAPLELLHIDNVIVEMIPSDGRTLFRFGYAVAAELDRQRGIDVDGSELITRLRPGRGEAFSIRYRGGIPPAAAARSVVRGARAAGWKVALLSPDGAFFLVLTFATAGERFDDLAPLFSEMARRVRWAAEVVEAGAGPVTITSRTLDVHSEPAKFSPVVGKVQVGGQYSILERDFSGSWWRISYGGQPGWVSDPLVAAAIPNAPVSVPVAMIDRRVNVRSGPGASNPVIGVAVPGQQYLITGKSLDGAWWQIDDNGRPGWVLGDLVSAVDTGGVRVAVVNYPLPPLLAVTEAVLTVNRSLNVRGGPHASYPIVGAAVPGRHYRITGKSAGGDWWRIDDDGRIGWVFGELATLVNTAGLQVVARFPIPPLLPATETVLTFNRRMNVYSGPGARYSVIDTTIPGVQYPVTGRNAVGSWWQIENQSQPGWVFGQLAVTVDEEQEER